MVVTVPLWKVQLSLPTPLASPSGTCWMWMTPSSSELSSVTPKICFLYWKVNFEFSLYVMMIEYMMIKYIILCTPEVVLISHVNLMDIQ